MGGVLPAVKGLVSFFSSHIIYLLCESLLSVFHLIELLFCFCFCVCFRCMIRWRKRGELDTPQHVYVSSPPFPGRRDGFQNGGSEGRSGRVWPREKDRGASSPVGRRGTAHQNTVLKTICMCILPVILIQFYYEWLWWLAYIFTTV